MSEQFIMGHAPQRDSVSLPGVGDADGRTPHAATGEMLVQMRKDTPGVSAVLAAWYRIRGKLAAERISGRVLLACSGGADSSALVVAMSGITNAHELLVVAHVMHDLRPAAQALADAARVAELARRVIPTGLKCVQASVQVAAAAGNVEANARKARYAALGAMAEEYGCDVVMTGHTQSDQAETVLMRLIRGAGPRGLAAMPECRPLAAGKALWLVRPMLGVAAAEAKAICQRATWQWCEDSTNSDTAMLRAAMRHNVLPLLESISPGATERIAGAASVQRAAAEAIGDIARVWCAKGPPWKRAELATLSPAVIAEMLMRSASGTGADAVRRVSVASAVRAIVEGVSSRKAFVVGGVVVRVSGGVVTVERRGPGAFSSGGAGDGGSAAED